MKKIGLNELREVQLEILDNVDGFCRRQGIKYWIDGGTLLGAVRHKGYIPWDDDIDLGMLRQDYDKFMRTFNNENSVYKFICIENTPGFYCPFGKVIDTRTKLIEGNHTTSINIDIFVYDNAPDTDKMVKKMFDRRDLIRKWYYKRINLKLREGADSKLKIYCKKIFLKFISPDIFLKKIVRNSKKYMRHHTKRVGNFTGYTPFTCSKEVFKTFIEVEFEGRKYMAPVGYDLWLKSCYGDYMVLPPEEERKTTHFFEAYM